jgi:hypothetical protein
VQLAVEMEQKARQSQLVQSAPATVLAPNGVPVYQGKRT